MVTGYRLILCMGLWVRVSLIMCRFSLILTPSMNGFAELPATLDSELGCRFGIQFKRVEFELYIIAHQTNPSNQSGRVNNSSLTLLVATLTDNSVA